MKVGGTFELERLEKKVRLPGGKSIAISEDTLDDLLLSTKGHRSFALLSLFATHFKFNQVQFHQDHIHPYAGFSTGILRKLKLDDDKIRDWQVKRDILPNLQLLEGRENQGKCATPFEVWLRKEYPKDTDLRAFLRSNHIPNVSLELSEFDNLFEKRRGILKAKLGKMLNVRMK